MRNHVVPHGRELQLRESTGVKLCLTREVFAVLQVRKGPTVRAKICVLIRLVQALVFLFITAFAAAQYRATQWTADSGLPQNSVRGIVQTPDGYIWVATLNGVARFDGIRFTVFNKSNTPGISSNRIVAMVKGAGGDLWLASEDNNLIRYHEGRFSVLDEATGIRPHSVNALTSDAHDAVWVLSDGHIVRWNPSARIFVRESFGDEGTVFNSLWWVGTGFWSQRNGELICVAHGRLQKFSLPSDLKAESIRGVAVGGDGVVWVATHDRRFGTLSNGRYNVYTTPAVTDFINQTRRNWKVHISLNFARTLVFPSGGMDKGITYNILLRDRDENMWVGSEGEGLFRIQSQLIKSLDTTQGLASANVYPVMQSRSGDLWVGSWPAGLTRIRNGQVVSAMTEKDGLPGLVTALAEDKDGKLWIGSHNGVRVLNNGRLSTPALLPASMPVAQAIFPAADGRMLFGTPNGLYVLDGDNSHWMTTREGLATDDVRVIVSDRRGDIWIGGYGGLTRMRGQELTRWTEAEGLPSNNVRSIYQDSAGELWVGTYDGGFGWLRNGKWVVFNEERGLSDNGAFQILESQGYFWISSNSGIYRVRRSELVDVEEGRRPRIVTVAYGRADGMLSVECNGGLWPAGAKDEQGRMWFPTQRGVAIVDPSLVQVASKPPQVKIESASIEHKPQSETEEIVLRPGQTNLEIGYTALSYIRPEQITFRYMLDGVDRDWQEVGTRRTAYYSHLPPGEYRFHVAARSSDGVESVGDTAILVRVVPPFYRRSWFLVLVALVAATMAWLIWSYRIRQLKKAQAAQQAFSRELIASQESERRRIAAELHDSLGQRLIVINNLALFLLRPKGKVRSEEEKQQAMEEISSEASQAIEETRSISYALRPFQLDRLGLTKAIQALGKTASRSSQIEITMDLDNIDEVFPETLRINFFRIVQEALNNIIKHSGATQAQVSTARSDKSVTLAISDNGRGLPSEPRAAADSMGGFGLTGMRERTTLLHGVMHIKSEMNVGTTLIIVFPTKTEH